jgi:hypothetical protein
LQIGFEFCLEKKLFILLSIDSFRTLYGILQPNSSTLFI